MLDSNVVIAAMLGTNDTLRARMKACDEGDFAISAIAYAEVAFGSMRGKPPPLDRLQLFAEEAPVLDFDAGAAAAYAALPFERASFDRLIAAHALARGMILVTDNVRHFKDVPELRVENWMS